MRQEDAPPSPRRPPLDREQQTIGEVIDEPSVPDDDDDDGDDDCSPADVAREDVDCIAAARADRATFDSIRVTEFDALRRRVYLHTLSVSAYEGELRRYNTALSAFSGAVAAYEQALAGRTYTTTALDSLADELDTEHDALETQRRQVDTDYDARLKEANGERTDLKTLKSHLNAFIALIRRQLATFDCVACPALEALLARVEGLLASCTFTIKDPSARPAGVPTVARLPAPPQPSSAGPGRASQPHAPKVKVYLSNPQQFAITHIDSGYVWPYVLPVDGVARVCVQVPYWWSPTVQPHHAVRFMPPVDPNGDYIQFHFEFTQPAITLGGGLTPTDISISEDRYSLFFTLADRGLVANPGLYELTITDADTTIHLTSSDPSTSIAYVEDLDKGLAALEFSLLIAADDVMEKRSSASPDFAAYLDALSNALDAYTLAFESFGDRFSASGAVSHLAQPLDMPSVAGPHWQPPLQGGYDTSLGGYSGFGLDDWDIGPSLADTLDWFAGRIVAGASICGITQPNADELTKFVAALMRVADTRRRLKPV